MPNYPGLVIYPYSWGYAWKTDVHRSDPQEVFVSPAAAQADYEDFLASVALVADALGSIADAAS